MSQSCNPCDPGSCGEPPSGTILLKKLDYMIGDNYTLLFILFIVFCILGLAMYYFVNSLKDTLVNYYSNKKKVVADTSVSDNPRQPKDDNYTYYPDPKEDPEKTGTTRIPDKKGDFAEELEKRYQDVNKDKTSYIQTTYNGRDNDDPIDQRTLFQGHDTYKYDKDKA